MNGAKLVSSALLGLDYKTVVLAGRRYVIEPPTIKKLAGVAYNLANLAEAQTLADIITSQDDIQAIARAVSWLIAGDESLTDELSECKIEELTEALKEGYDLVSVQSFIALSALAKSVASLTAKQKR